jgi:hypothetical protein
MSLGGAGEEGRGEHSREGEDVELFGELPWCEVRILDHHNEN